MNVFNQGILELTKNGKATTDDRLKTNNKLFKIEKFYIPQKRILTLKDKNNEETEKAFKEFQSDAKENYNRIRQSFFLAPITNELGEINKEELQKFIIQTNDIANAETTLNYLKEISTIQAESQTNKILELHILFPKKQGGRLTMFCGKFP